MQSSLLDLYADYELYRLAEIEDNKKDEDGDGVPDVNQIVRAARLPTSPGSNPQTACTRTHAPTYALTYRAHQSGKELLSRRIRLALATGASPPP